jgi:serine O-acetyltransferase
MLDSFKADAQRWSVLYLDEEDGEPPSLLRSVRLIRKFPALGAMFWFRVGQAANQRGIRGVPSRCSRRLPKKYAFEILMHVDVGPGLYVPHPAGTVVSPERMGSNVTIVHNVTIGMRKEQDFPTIGDGVYIGAGARVLGAIQIGDNAQIGANAVVTKDVAANTTVVGIPARPIG